MEYYENNLAVTQQIKLDMIQQMQQQKLIQRLLMFRYWLHFDDCQIYLFYVDKENHKNC